MIRWPGCWRASLANIRYLAYRDLLEIPAADPQQRGLCSEAHRQGPIAAILNEMDPAGFWVEPGPGYLPKYRSTVWSLVLLAQLGARIEEDPRIPQACAYLVEHALTRNGIFTTSGAPSGTADCLQGNLAWALLELGFDDPRLAPAFDWMARSVTGEGIAPMEDRQAPERYYAGKCGPNFACGSNNKLPCAWGAAKVMLALGKWPVDQRTPAMDHAIQQGIDFLLGVDPLEAAYPCGYAEKPSQNWWKFGFPVFYVTDLLQVAQALVALGRGSDPRLANLLGFIREKQDQNGRWALDYDYTGKTWVDFGAKKQPNPWVTLRALRILKRWIMKAAFALLANHEVTNQVRKVSWKMHQECHVGIKPCCLPPHVSLKQPFRIDDLAGLEAYMDELAASIEPFEIHLPQIQVVPVTYDGLETGLLWLDVAEKPELRQLHERLNAGLSQRFGDTRADFDGAAYHFHMTVMLGEQPIETYRKFYTEIADPNINLRFTTRELALFVYDEPMGPGAEYLCYRIVPLGRHANGREA